MGIQNHIPKRIAAIILNSLKGGVVPRLGLPYITVGRDKEIEALLHDLDLVRNGGASFRFLMGRYGSGKSFLLQTIRTHALGKNFIVADADLSPERRFYGAQGQGLATYRELIKNISTKTRPEGGALPLILERWAKNVYQHAQQKCTTQYPQGFTEQQFSEYYQAECERIYKPLRDLVHGFEFTEIIRTWLDAYQKENTLVQHACLKWLRGEYHLKTEAKKDLGISEIISDESWYDYLKLLAMFLVHAGYDGLIILIDELVNLYKIPHSLSRQYNYEKILTMYNDTLQGKAQYIDIIMAGTQEAIEDTRKGIFSYEALASRLRQGRFTSNEYADMLAPLIRLHPLTPEQMLILIEKLAYIHAGYYNYEPQFNEQDLADFLSVELRHIGSTQLITPREIIRDFIELLDIAIQTENTTLQKIIKDQLSASQQLFQNDFLQQQIQALDQPPASPKQNFLGFSELAIKQSSSQELTQKITLEQQINQQQQYATTPYKPTSHLSNPSGPLMDDFATFEI